MRLQRKSSPDTMNAGPAESAGLSQCASRPVGLVKRLRLQSQSEDAVHIGLTQSARRSRPWFVQQTIQTPGQEALPPLADSLYRDVQLGGCIGVRITIGTEQNHAGAKRECLRTFGLPGPGAEGFTFCVCQYQYGCWTSGFHPRILHRTIAVSAARVLIETGAAVTAPVPSCISFSFRT